MRSCVSFSYFVYQSLMHLIFMDEIDDSYFAGHCCILDRIRNNTSFVTDVLCIVTSNVATGFCHKEGSLGGLSRSHLDGRLA